jgi:HEPN domain-containing protein
MLDLERQIEYWKAGAFDDLETAKVLIDKDRLLHGLFFCHLVIEKIIKAHVVKQTREFAPRTHNLFNLSEKANLEFNEDQEIFPGILMKYQLQGRYPDYNPNVPNRAKITEYLIQTENLVKWLEAKLSSC